MVVALSATSCMTPFKYYGSTFVTKDGDVVRNVSQMEAIKVMDYQQHLDTAYYQYVDTTVVISSREDRRNWRSLVLHDSIHAIANSDILTGRSFEVKKQKDGSYCGEDYIPLRTLPKDTIVDTWGSVITTRLLWKETENRLRYMGGEYVLSLADNTHYVIPRKQIDNFYKHNSPDIYKLWRKEKTTSNFLVPGFLFTLVGYTEALVFGIIAIAAEDEVFGYVSLGCAAVGTAFCIPLVKCMKQPYRDPVEVYNQQHYDKYKAPEVKLSLNAHVNTNGVGLSLQF